MTHRLFCAAAACAAALTAVPASALTVHSTRASFEAAFASVYDPTGMTGAATQAEADALAVGGQSYDRVATGKPADVELLSGITFEGRATGGTPLAHGFYDTYDLTDVGIAGAAYAVYNPVNENHTIHLPKGMTSFGFEIFDPADGRCVVSCSASTFSISAYDPLGDLLSTTAVSPGQGAVAFWGLESEAPIASIIISETAGYYDNEYFGNYVTGLAAPLSDVPLPAGAALLLSAFGLLALRRKA